MLPPELVRHSCTDKRLGDCAKNIKRSQALLGNNKMAPRDQTGSRWICRLIFFLGDNTHSYIFFPTIYFYIYFFFLSKKTIDSTRDWLVTRGWLGLEVDSCNATTLIKRLQTLEFLELLVGLEIGLKNERNSVETSTGGKRSGLNCSAGILGGSTPMTKIFPLFDSLSF